jgi:hypothetical protein
MEQISKLGTGERQLNQLDRIKAIIKSCQDPLQKFLDRISKFDQSLGAQSVRAKSAKNLGRRVQWKLAYKDDVTELRAVLRGHVGLLTLLINLQTLFVYLFLTCMFIILDFLVYNSSYSLSTTDRP